MVPKSTQVVLLADRGFGRAHMAQQCQTLGFGYILQIQPKVFVRTCRFQGLLKDWPIQRGQSKLLRNVGCRKDHPVPCHVAIIWRPDQEEPWYLITNRADIPVRRLWKVFAYRMSIEEYFRDTKSPRNGFALRLTQIQDSQRLSRFLPLLAWAYILLVAMGLYASKRFRPGQWCSNNRSGECSFFTIGKAMLHRVLPSPTRLARDLRMELLSPNWG
jgi:predicted small integral membrane protein